MPKPKTPKPTEERCTNCGYCLHCGRSNTPVRVVPYFPYVPYVLYNPSPPYWQPYWVNTPTITYGGVSSRAIGTSTIAQLASNCD